MTYDYILITDLKVNILSDSIAKHVSGIHYTEMHPFPGINIARLTAKIERYPELVSRPYSSANI